MRTPSPLSCGNCYGRWTDRVYLETDMPPSAERRSWLGFTSRGAFRTPAFYVMLLIKGGDVPRFNLSQKRCITPCFSYGDI